jgi:hypothetical protein
MAAGEHCRDCDLELIGYKSGTKQCKKCKNKNKYLKRKARLQKGKLNGLEKKEVQIKEQDKQPEMETNQQGESKGNYNDLKEAYKEFKNETKNQITELKGTIAKLTSKNEKLTEVNTNLRIENQIKDQKHELALTESAVNSKATLGGFVKDALDKDNLASIAEIIKAFKGVKDDKENQNNHPVQGISTGDVNKDAMINNMIQVLSGKEMDFVTKFYGVLSASLNSNLLDTVIGMINKANEQAKLT